MNVKTHLQIFQTSKFFKLLITIFDDICDAINNYAIYVLYDRRYCMD